MRWQNVWKNYGGLKVVFMAQVIDVFQVFFIELGSSSVIPQFGLNVQGSFVTYLEHLPLYHPTAALVLSGGSLTCFVVKAKYWPAYAF